MRLILPVLTIVVAFSSLTGCATTAVLHEGPPVNVMASPPPPPPPPPPPEPPPRVEVEETRIRVDEKIHFELDSAEISAVSEDLIKEIATVMNDNPHITRIRIEGHTDSTGTPEYNMTLSQRRAESVVKKLAEFGVDEGRMEPKGFGLTRPIATNETAAGMAQNRRVEFNIVEQGEKAAAPPAAEAPAAAPPAASEEGSEAPAAAAPATVGPKKGGAQ